MIVAGCGTGFGAAATAAAPEQQAGRGVAPDRLPAPMGKCAAYGLDAPVRGTGLSWIAVAAEGVERQSILAQPFATARGTGGVAKAAALAVAGPGLSLPGPREIAEHRLAARSFAKVKSG